MGYGNKARLNWVDAPMELGAGFWVTGPVPRVTDFEDTGGSFFLDAAGREPDPLHDDQAAVLDTPQGLCVILGCAHAGVINTLLHVHGMFPRRAVHTLIGGMHLGGASENRLQQTLEHLRAYDVQRFYPIHCTGFNAACRLRQVYAEKVQPAPAGTRIYIDA